MDKIFIDSNIIIYANDKQDKTKQDKAIQIIGNLMEKKIGTISTQVMQEYAFVALTKLKQKHEIVLRQLKLMEVFEIIHQSPEMIRRAIEIMKTYNISF